MLILNLQRVFVMRGILNPYTLLVKRGVSRPTAWNLLNNNTTQIKSKHLELICELLNCEPNDLYEWKPDKNTQNAENHPLKALRRVADAGEFRQIVGKIPLGKIDQVKEMLSDLGE